MALFTKLALRLLQQKVMAFRRKRVSTFKKRLRICVKSFNIVLKSLDPSLTEVQRSLCQEGSDYELTCRGLIRKKKYVCSECGLEFEKACSLGGHVSRKHKRPNDKTKTGKESPKTEDADMPDSATGTLREDKTKNTSRWEVKEQEVLDNSRQRTKARLYYSPSKTLVKPLIPIPIRPGKIHYLPSTRRKALRHAKRRQASRQVCFAIKEEEEDESEAYEPEGGITENDLLVQPVRPRRTISKPVKYLA